MGAAEEELDPLLELLVKRGVITAEEAAAVQAEYDQLERGEAAPVDESAPAAVEPVTQDQIQGVKGLKLGTLTYISAQRGNAPDGAGGTESYNQFRLKRAYIDIRKEVFDGFDVRITPDVHQDSTGDLKVRLKYLYARFGFRDLGLLHDPHVEFGVAHMPWLDFEEHINLYRMQDTMFMERNGLFNSADIGILFASKLGEDLGDEHLEYMNSHYAGRWGSFGVGVFNGGGYHASEKNDNKALEGRLTLRPMPDLAPGFQVSVFGFYGDGNQPDDLIEPPETEVLAAMLSWESPRWVATAQVADGKGNQTGSAVGPDGRALPFDGYSLFTEVRLDRERRFSLIGRFDHFDASSDDPASDVEERWIAGVAWRFFKGNTWLLDYDRLEHSAPGMPAEDRLQLTLQIKY
jgi:hypothetical protein